MRFLDTREQARTEVPKDFFLKWRARHVATAASRARQPRGPGRNRPGVAADKDLPTQLRDLKAKVATLEAAGFRVLAPNQRGYGKSEKPNGVSAYDIEHLAQDIIALADSEPCETFTLVGHDWGGIVAWWVAARFPERVTRLINLNAPHPGIFYQYLLRHPSQVIRSWYAGVFQIPWLPEALLSAKNYELLFQSVRLTSRPGVFDESDRRYLVAGWSQPGALTSMLNYYRAIARRSSKSLNSRITVPTLILFGKKDPTEEPGLAEASWSLCDEGRLVWLEQARHWIQREEHVRVTEEIIQFCAP